MLVNLSFISCCIALEHGFWTNKLTPYFHREKLPSAVEPEVEMAIEGLHTTLHERVTSAVEFLQQGKNISSFDLSFIIERHSDCSIHA